MIRVQNLSKQFNSTTVVSNVSFEVHQDETMVLLGTSGSGKTTTLKMINRLIAPDDGSVFIDGIDTLYQKPEILRRQIGFVLQNMGLFPHYTVEENISTVPVLMGWDKKRINQRVQELMEKLRLPFQEFSKSYPKQLSGGQQQRVGLARALAANPPVLLMDEPFSALDPITRKSIRKEFRELDELKNKTVIMVTHDVQEAFEMADRICLMHEGSIVQSGSPSDIVLRKQHEFVTQFLSDQQTMLELKAVPMSNYWKEIATLDSSIKPLTRYSTHQSLFDIIENTVKRPVDEQTFIVHDDQGNEKVTSLQLLMQTFTNFKSRYQ
jgi:osmoprotectant transport system ATP-binding protein